MGGEIFYVDVAFNHPSYGRNGVDGDISVVRLATRMILKPNIQQATIVLPESVLPDHLPVIFAGWGRIFVSIVDFIIFIEKSYYVYIVFITFVS